MTTNLKLFFLFISAFLINVQFTTPIESATTEPSHYSEQVTELVELDRQEDRLLFTQALFSELTGQDPNQQFSATNFVFNQDQINRQQYQAQAQLAFKNQSNTQLKFSLNDHLFYLYPPSFSDENNTSTLFQLS
jgi:hypothetical protein